MNPMLKKISIRPNQKGYLFQKNKLKKIFEPGIYYKYFDLLGHVDVVVLPTITQLLIIINQEVLTKDNIALRFSYIIEYKITVGEKFLVKFDVFRNQFSPLTEAENLIHNLSQIYLRETISQISSEELNEKRGEILNNIPSELKRELVEYGIELQKQMLRDITFPKSVQELFAKQLEAKIRARADLENARTAVATARALKNASALMDKDENIKYIQFLETINKIAAKGNHTFVVGNFDAKDKWMMK